MLGANLIRPPVRDDGSKLWIQEIFYTLQGEGPFSGQPAVFVRLGGCNLACYFCDTDFESSQWQPSLTELLTCIKSELTDSCRLIVITGGEPFRQSIAPLVRGLLALPSDLVVQIETNGTLYAELPWSPRLHVVCSPKTSGLHPQLVPYIDSYKYVLRDGEIDEEDGLPAGSYKKSGMPELIARPEGDKPVFVMPMDEQDEDRNARNISACIKSCLKHGYRLTLQTHKLIGVR